jgi:oxalate decarboxylase/phosphoglucose isomerase-like protein (cupin superfamily)
MITRDKIEIIDLPKVEDSRGNLSFIEEVNHIPFKIQRVYWIYDVPGGESRGSHAFKETEELIIALSGSFDAILHDGKTEQNFSLNRSYYGIYIPKMTWRKLENFSTNSLALILSSTEYSQTDYIRDFDRFLNLISKS